jgi:hypothetical protein
MRFKFFRFLFGTLLVVIFSMIIIGLVFLKPLDNRPYYKSDFFLRTSKAIENNKQFELGLSGDTVKAGWSRASLIPPFGTPIAIDANRQGKFFDGIHDSIFVRSFVFSQGNKKVAYVSVDLLIVPPTVTEILDTLLKSKGYDLQNIYLSATHTHCSIGAWHNSFIGEIFAGQYDARVPPFIAQQVATSILSAEKNQSKIKIGYKSIATHKLVYNRLLEKGGEVDSNIRIVKIEKETGEKACLITFTAHATCLHDRVMELSGDWPGMMMHKLDSSGKSDFTCFSAGSVGSHGPFKCKKDKWQQLTYTTNGATKVVFESLDAIQTSYVTKLNMTHQPIELREPNYRVNAFLVLRPHWFIKFFGRQNNYINMLQLGDIVFAGMPCDFSGEMNEELDEQASNMKKKLMVTSFNGCFMGYVTDDRRYSMNSYETRTMNWYGPGNGAYFTELIMKMMDRLD